MCVSFYILFFFFFNDTATTEIYTLSLHDALPISQIQCSPIVVNGFLYGTTPKTQDRKSTRLNSSHSSISYAVFCLKKKKKYKDALIGHCFTGVLASDTQEAGHR